MITLAGYINPLFGATQKTLEAALADLEIEQQLKKSVSLIATLESIQQTVSARYEYVVLQQATDEGKHAIFLLSIGSYRNAYSSLRLFFDLNLAAIDFSTNQRQFLNWTLGRGDISWSRLSDPEEGVLSKSFCGLFPIDLSDHAKSYRTMATSVYRECSEYVHGNPSTNSKLPVFPEFRKEIVLDWCSKLDTMYLVCIFLFSVRYLTELSPEQLEKVKPDLLDQVSHLTQIRDYLGGAIGG